MTSAAPPQWASRIVGHSRVDPSTLLASPLNWRAHPKNQRDALRGGIQDLGFIRSVSVNQRTGTVIDGHLRVATALEEKQTEIDVEWVDLTLDEERQALASLDSIAGLAKPKLLELETLLRSISFTSEATSRFLADFAKKNGLFLQSTERAKAEDAGPQLDKADALRIKWGTRRGQLWTIPSMTTLGQAHRLLVGDCTQRSDVARVMGGERGWLAPTARIEADLVATDPPYGVDYVGKTKDALTIANDNRGHVGTRMLIQDAVTAWPLKPGGAWYIFSPAGDMELAFRLGLLGAGQELRQTLVWVKHHFVMGRQDYHWRHESLLYGWNAGAAHYFVPDYTQDTVIDDTPDPAQMSKKELLELVKELRRAENSDVWQEDRPSASLLHPTTKPTALIRKMLLNNTRPGDIVFDGFCGSGTTLVGAEQNARLARVMDIEPKYAAATLERALLLGLNPMLEDDDGS